MMLVDCKRLCLNELVLTSCLRLMWSVQSRKTGLKGLQKWYTLCWRRSIEKVLLNQIVEELVQPTGGRIRWWSGRGRDAVEVSAEEWPTEVQQR